MTSIKWVFEQSPDMGGVSGEGFTNPLLGSGMEPAADLAREVIQNSTDAQVAGEGLREGDGSRPCTHFPSQLLQPSARLLSRDAGRSRRPSPSPLHRGLWHLRFARLTEEPKVSLQSVAAVARRRLKEHGSRRFRWLLWVRQVGLFVEQSYSHHRRIHRVRPGEERCCCQEPCALDGLRLLPWP